MGGGDRGGGGGARKGRGGAERRLRGGRFGERALSRGLMGRRRMGQLERCWRRSPSCALAVGDRREVRLAMEEQWTRSSSRRAKFSQRDCSRRRLTEAKIQKRFRYAQKGGVQRALPASNGKKKGGGEGKNNNEYKQTTDRAANTAPRPSPTSPPPPPYSHSDSPPYSLPRESPPSPPSPTSSYDPPSR